MNSHIKRMFANCFPFPQFYPFRYNITMFGKDFGGMGSHARKIILCCMGSTCCCCCELEPKVSSKYLSTPAISKQLTSTLNK